MHRDLTVERGTDAVQVPAAEDDGGAHHGRQAVVAVHNIGGSWVLEGLKGGGNDCRRQAWVLQEVHQTCIDAACCCILGRRW